MDSSALSDDDDEDEATDNDVSVTDSASEERDSSEDETGSAEYVCLMKDQTLNFAFCFSYRQDYVLLLWAGFPLKPLLTLLISLFQ